MHHCIYLAYTSTAKKKKGSKELKDLEKRLNQSMLPAQHSPRQLNLAREGVQGQPLGHELLGSALSNEQISILHLVSEPADLEAIYLNSTGGKRQPLNWDEVELGGLSELSLVILDGGGSLDWAERLLFGGAPVVMALRYQQGEAKAEVAQHFLQQFYHHIAHGQSIHEAYQSSILPEALFVSQHTVIPSDPYDYWDFREALEGKSQFPWGLYLLPDQEESLQKTFFTELSLPEVAEPVEEEVAEIAETPVEAEASVESVVEAITAPLSEVAEPVEEEVAEITETPVEAEASVESVVEAITAPLSEVAEPVEEEVAEITETPVEAEASVESVVEAITAPLSELAEPVAEEVAEIAETSIEAEASVESVVEEIAEPLPELAEPVAEEVAEIAAPLSEVAEPVEEELAEIAEPPIEAEASVETVTEAITAPLPEVAEPVEEEAAEITETPVEAEAPVETVVEAITAPLPEVAEPVEEEVAEIAEPPIEAEASVESVVEAITAPLPEVAEPVEEEVAEAPVEAEAVESVVIPVYHEEEVDELENLILEELLQVEELDFSGEIVELTEEESKSEHTETTLQSGSPEEVEEEPELPIAHEDLISVEVKPIALFEETEKEQLVEILAEPSAEENGQMESLLLEIEEDGSVETEIVAVPIAEGEETLPEDEEEKEGEETVISQEPIPVLEDTRVLQEESVVEKEVKILEPVSLIEAEEMEGEEESYDADPLLHPVSLLEMEEEEETDEPDSEEEESMDLEEEQEVPFPVHTSGTATLSPPEAAVVRINSTQVKNSPKPRTLANVRSRESDGILRKVAYWSQELSETPTLEETSSKKKEPVSLQPAETHLSAPAVIPMLEEKYERSSPFAHETIRLKTNAPGEEPTKNYGSFRKVFAMVGMGIMMLAVGSGLIYNYLKADKQAALSTLSMFEPGGTYNILILPFTPDGDCQSANSFQESSVRDHLSSLPEIKDLGLQVAFLDGVACPQNSEEAKVTGKLHNAQLVIWGEASRNEFAQEQIYVNYVALGNDTRSNQRVAQGIGQRALEDVYDLQEGDFAGEAQDLVYWILAITHLRREDYASAISYIEQITIREEAEYAVLMHMLAKCYQGMGRLNDALTAYGEAIYLNPQNANFYHHRGILHQQLEQKAEALEDYTEAIRLNPQHLKAQYQRNLLLEDETLTNEVQVNQAAAALPVAN